MYFHNKITALEQSALRISPSYKKKEASLWRFFQSYKRGSLTIEAAAVCSLSLLVLGSVLMLFVALQKEYQLKERMYLTQERMLWDEQTDESMAIYEETVSVPLFVWRRKISISNRITVYGFNGYKGNLSFGETYVFITKYGEVYHQSPECSHLNIQMQSIYYRDVHEKRNFTGGKYYPCEECCLLSTGEICYITEYGNRYHTKKDCRNIVRWIEKVRLSEVSDRGACSECW